ncbi:hypothetical protein SGFS_024520 [Streptomyces graminofaciens]|uniref:Uncharacterized protein n=1 Tax=Streptomyces graminofaciens TaxID=68212 RepID=A0ABN5VDZ5_9ACTN|nr:hypothetical protein SGFS_024520 [Streptomyces graminofaciens]
MAMSGTHVQKVSSVGVFIALSMSAWLTGFAEAEEPPPLSPQAVRAAPSETAPAAVRKSRRLIWEGLGVERILNMVNSRRWLREGTPDEGMRNKG